MCAAARRGESLPDPAPVGQHADAIARIQSHLRESERGVHREVELAQAAHSRAHQAAGIDQNPHRLALLDLVEPRDRLAAPRAGGPADVAELVSLAVFAKTLECRARTAGARGAPLELDLAAAHQEDGLPLGFLQVGIRDHRLCEVGPGPALGDLHRALVSDVRVAQARLAAFVRHDEVAPLRLALRADVDLKLGRLDAQLWRYVI